MSKGDRKRQSSNRIPSGTCGVVSLPFSQTSETEIILERFAKEGDSPVRIPMFGEEVSRVVRVGILA